MPHRLAIVIAVLLTSLAPAGAAFGASAGGGAELPARAYQYWCAHGADCTYDVHDADLDAGALGSGEIQWIGVDEPLDAAQRRAAGGPLEHVPVMLAAIAVSVNIPGVSGHHVDLTGRTLGQIFSGEITRWSDARIRRQNPNQPVGRGGPITLCVPAQRSGTTWDMTEYLARVSPEFRERVGGPSERPASWRAPRVVRVADVAALGRCVLEHEGAIAFWDYADALRNGEVEDIIAVGEVKTVSYPRKGKPAHERPELVYSHPSEHGMLAAGTAIERSLGGRLAFDATSASSVDAYPITTLSWVAFRADRGLTPGAKASLTHMLSPAGQARLQGLGYGRLSPATLAHARKTIAAAPRAAKAAGRAEARPAERLTVDAGAIAQAVANSGLLKLGNVTVTSTSSPITATATLTTVVNPVSMNVTVTYTNDRNWTINVQRNSAASGYVAPLQTGLNVNNISGTITNTDGNLSYNLVLGGQVLGNGVFDMTVTVSATTGLQATANVTNVTVGGFVIRTGTVTVSTADSTSSVVATLDSTIGTFDAFLSIRGPLPNGRRLAEVGAEAPAQTRRGGANSAGPDAPPPPPPPYEIEISVSGADLAGSNSQFKVTSFTFKTKVTVDPRGCQYIWAHATGTVVIKNTTYTMKDAYIAICGSRVDQFYIDVTVSHYLAHKKATIIGELRIAWGTPPSGKPYGTYTTPGGATINYASGFFGSVSLKHEREYKAVFDLVEFKRTVTIGLAFGVAVYTPAGGGPQAVVVGAGGGVKADRIEGALGCEDQGTDFKCAANIRVNPPSSGVFNEKWEGF